MKSYFISSESSENESESDIDLKATVIFKKNIKK